MSNSNTQTTYDQPSTATDSEVESTPDSVLEIDSLSVEYATENGAVRALRDVSLDLTQGETLGIAGESGSGKSTLALAVLQYLSENGSVVDGEIRFNGRRLSDFSKKELRAIRGSEIAHVPQDPGRSLNPSLTVGEQIAETIRLHQDLGKKAVTEAVHRVLRDVDISDPEYNAKRYPHQLSGGMQQRVLIAMALCCNPELLILDEPTTGLDVTTEAKVLQLIESLKAEYETSVMLITHDLSVIAEVADRAAILYAGELMETAPVEALFAEPAHPYTQGLLAAVPTLWDDTEISAVPGSVPDLIDVPDGCVFADRCPFATEECRTGEIPMETVEGAAETDRGARCIRLDAASEEPIQPTGSRRTEHTPGRPLLEAIQLKKYYDEPSFLDSLRNPDPPVKAVDGVSFTIHESETLALVGESGCGKSTLGRTIFGLLEPTDGSIRYRGKSMAGLIEREREQFRAECGIVFQNPDSSLNPRKTIYKLIERPLIRFTELSKPERRERVLDMLSEVGLGPAYAERYPSELSGGEKQRVGIARAFINNPSFVVLDEPVSALDVSVQASILDLLDRLRREYDTSYLLISHDLSVVNYISDRVAVMYLGNIVEIGSREDVFSPPYHPYTRLLLSSVPSPDPTHDVERTFPDADLPSPRDPPSGCVFHTRCPQKIGDECESCTPELDNAEPTDHGIRCHLDDSEMSDRIDRAD